MSRKINALLLIAAMLCVVGCQTPGKLLATTVTTVDSAMKGWAQYVAIAKPPAEQETKVKAAYEKYQAIELVMEKAYIAYTISGDKSGFEVAAAAMKGAQSDLITLISLFSNGGVK